ncbi:helix-turn-helix transcriptional regulator [Mycobacterium sp. C31M]
MLVFDSASVPKSDRQSAIVDSITSAAGASFMTPQHGGERLHLTLSAWQLGSVEVVDAKCSAHTLRRSSRQRSDDGTVIALTCGRLGRGLHRQHDREWAVKPADVWATNLAEPYTHHVTDTWTTTAKLPADLLGVPLDLVGPALGHVGRSPLAPLFSRHLMHLRDVADDVNGVAEASLGTATLALARALLASVSNDAAFEREALEDSLMPRVMAFIRTHLPDASLDAASIAAANHVSVRQLYKIFARADLSLEKWIIEQRLACAHEELTVSAQTPAPIAAVAHRWGFSDASHFARRFRSLYGMSPREWQALNRHDGRR